MHQKKTKSARVLAYGLGGLFLAWLSLSVLVFANNRPALPAAPVDAVILLAGSSTERLPVAQNLAAKLEASVLVLSRTDTPGNTSADELCRNGTPGGASLICFRPQGMDTRSEAATIADLVATNGWSSVVVVTSTYHVARAETLVRQCVDDARVTMASSEPELDPMGWLRRFVIETGGLLDVHLRPEC